VSRKKHPPTTSCRMKKLECGLLLAFMGLLTGADRGFAQPLPGGVTVQAFYDTNKVGLSFSKDKLSTIGMWEVPGKPQHFLVLGYWGFVWSLYPDTLKGDTTVPNISVPIRQYTRKEVADFSERVMKGHEQGSTGAAFDPNFSKNRYFYILYNQNAEPSHFHKDTIPDSRVDGVEHSGLVVLERWIVGENYDTLTLDTTLLSMEHGAGYGSCSMVFGPDGYLYIATSGYNHDSWDSTSLMRKILRIDVSRRDTGKMYSIPSTNPWYEASNPDVKKEVYAFGIRNTYSLAVNHPTGRIWGSDVGQNRWEEINIFLPGRNYGWGNGGDASMAGPNSFGVEGPCSVNSTAGGAFTSTLYAGTANAQYMIPYERNWRGRRFTCADFTNGTWNFTHAGGALNGIEPSLLLPAAALSLSPSFRGSPSSPFYGHHFITDIRYNYFLAVKEGMPLPVLVGGLPSNIRVNVPLPHDGIVSFSEDFFGNLYVVLVSSSTQGPKNWHDIYRMSHPQLLATGQAPPVSLVKRPVKKVVGESLLQIPPGYTGVEIFTAEGRRAWAYTGSLKEVRVPALPNAGVFFARFTP
jgi:hypothetical protein